MLFMLVGVVNRGGKYVQAVCVYKAEGLGVMMIEKLILSDLVKEILKAFLFLEREVLLIGFERVWSRGEQKQGMVTS